MANPNAAYGLIPVRHMSGNSPRANKYTITSGLAENIFTGDLVILTSKVLLHLTLQLETNNIGVFLQEWHTLHQTEVMSIHNIGHQEQVATDRRCLCL